MPLKIGLSHLINCVVKLSSLTGSVVCLVYTLAASHSNLLLCLYKHCIRCFLVSVFTSYENLLHIGFNLGTDSLVSLVSLCCNLDSLLCRFDICHFYTFLSIKSSSRGNPTL